MSDDNYYRLLFAYPRRYRQERGRELVDTYRMMAGDRDRPRLTDATDLIMGGVRERLRAAGLAGLADALPVAAVFALSALSALSVVYLVVYEFHPATAEGLGSFGPFATFFVFAYVGWLVTAVLAAVAPGRPARIGSAVSLALLLAAVGLRLAHTSVPDLKMFLPFALGVLGVVALPLPTVTSRAARLAPVLAAVGTALAAAVRLPIGSPDLWHATSLWQAGPESYATCCSYRLPASYPLHLTAIGLLLAGVVAALWYLRRGSARGGWLLLVLATPIAGLEALQLATTSSIGTLALRVTGLIELQVCVAGLIVIAFTAFVAPLLIAALGGVLRITRRGKTTF
ncbi:hypothetical protein [Actinoplanes sp. N902-109]|uniref:hypothetical protein n=1 Tax=Actinoplanes sp. (strain N902-109) TaxID=649831 RepID=UPI00032957EA|nr:hypothetical protein [Actinoplanes sp. N902-109]AGL19288.1 hypothetical protein L083_5778 [Actinoplanes sp. N902-109]